MSRMPLANFASQEIVASSPRWIRWRNDAASDAPGGAIVRITGAADVDGQTVLTGAQANGSGQLHYINSPVAVAAGEYGLCTIDVPVRAAYDDANTPAFGELWGPASGSWLLTKAKAGFVILGDNDDGKVFVDRLSEGSLIRWTADGAFTTTDATFSVDVDIGANSGQTITVNNLPSNKTGDYVFYADDGDYGYAFHYAGNWYGFDPECP